jgi:hypothetical protein
MKFLWLPKRAPGRRGMIFIGQNKDVKQSCECVLFMTQRELLYNLANKQYVSKIANIAFQAV